ncbi:hypothetical protein E2C01_049662 [Portunus trituberculatus]|uniref:Uncharacterized protein n=1 Tax=Portunus trituberculatus TaxID=210409 RepID=A0A5B7GEY5_PORTR|nr:hypothetical protein [Portunus trituberculatus]
MAKSFTWAGKLWRVTSPDVIDNSACHWAPGLWAELEKTPEHNTVSTDHKLATQHAKTKDAEKRSAKEKKRTKSSGCSSAKRSRQQEPVSEAPWASRFVAVEADLAAMKASVGQLVCGRRSECASAPQVGVGGTQFLPGLAPGVSGGQASSVPSPAPELVVVGRVACLLSLFLALPRSFRGSVELAYVRPLSIVWPWERVGVQSSAVLGSSADFSIFGCVSFSAALLPTVARAVSVVQTPAVSGASREFSDLGGMSLCAAPLTGVASGLSGLQAHADPFSSVAGPGVGRLSLRTAPLSGKASGVCGEPAPARPVSSLDLVGGGETGLHAAPLPGGLPGDGNFAGSVGVSSMGLPHVDLLQGSMPS